MLKNDFYQAVNGKYLKKVKILPGTDQFSFAMKIQNKVFDHMQKLKPNSASPFLNTLHSKLRTVESLSEYSLIQVIIHRVVEMKSVSEIPDVLFDLHSYGCTPLFTVHSGSDFCNPGNEIIYLEEAEPVMEGVKQSDIKKLWKKFKVEIPMASVQDIVKLEKSLSKYGQTPTEKRNIKLNYNPTDQATLAKKLPWLFGYFKNFPKIPNRINLDNPKAYYSTVQRLTQSHLKHWKSYFLFHWLSHVAPLFVDLYKAQTAGDLEKPVKSEQSYKVRLAARVWWQDAGLQYVQHYVDPTVKDHARFIFKDIQTAMLKMLSQSSLEPVTKKEAIQKIQNMGVHLGWADQPRDLFLEPSDLYNSSCSEYTFEENYLIACNFQYWNVILQSQQKTNPKQWREMGYYMANACYVSEYNSLYIPAALFSSPYMYIDNILTSYPGIGRVMAHEMSHAIDSQGKDVDSTGKLRDWWSPKDSRTYKLNAQKTILLYSNYYTAKSKKINGLLTLTENISDLIALRVAWCAYIYRWSVTFKNEQVPLEVQRKYFKQLAFTRMFKTTKRVALLNLKEDPHSSPIARTNIPLSVCPHFYRLFDIEEGDSMFVRLKNWPRFFE